MPLRAAYSFDAGSGAIAADDSGNGFGVTLRQGASWVAGVTGSAIQASALGSGGVSTSQVILASDQQFTIMAWLRPTGATGNALFVEDGFGIGLEIAPDSSLLFWNSNPRVRSPVGAWSADTWVHVALVKDRAGNTMRLVVNGETVASDAAYNDQGSGRLEFGGVEQWGENGIATIDDLRIHDEALSDAAITTLMNAPVLPGESAPVTTSISPNNPSIDYDPAIWHVTSDRAATAGWGAGLRMLLESTTCAINFTGEGILAYRVNRSAWRYLGASGSLDFSAAMTWDRNLIEIRVANPHPTPGGFFNHGPMVEIQGFTVDEDAIIHPIPVHDGPRVLALGDSIMAGSTLGGTGINTHLESWLTVAADRIGARYGCAAFGYNGLTATTVWGDPPLTTTWNQLWDGQARDFTGIDIVLIMVGGGADQEASQAMITAATQTIVGDIHTALPSARIIFLRHTRPDGTGPERVYAAAAALASTDPLVSVIDTTGWVTEDDRSDNVHHFGYFDMVSFGPRVGNALSVLLDSTTSNAVTIWDGTAWV